MQTCLVNRCLYMLLLPVLPIAADVPVEVVRISADTAELYSRWTLAWTPSNRAKHVSMSVVTTTGRPCDIYSFIITVITL
jgi:hypothetical protein